MPKNYDQLAAMIERMETKLRQTRESVEYDRGPIRDTMKLVLPMMEDELLILKEMLEYVQAEKLHNGG